MNDDLFAARSELLLTLMVRSNHQFNEMIRVIVDSFKPFNGQMMQTMTAIDEAMIAIVKAFKSLSAMEQNSYPRCRLSRKEQNWARYCQRHSVNMSSNVP